MRQHHHPNHHHHHVGISDIMEYLVDFIGLTPKKNTDDFEFQVALDLFKRRRPAAEPLALVSIRAFLIKTFSPSLLVIYKVMTGIDSAHYSKGDGLPLRPILVQKFQTDLCNFGFKHPSHLHYPKRFVVGQPHTKWESCKPVLR